MTKIRDGVTIKVLPETRDRLKALKRGGESYDSVLSKLMDAYSQNSRPKS